jgi:hypothetical protein
VVPDPRGRGSGDEALRAPRRERLLQNYFLNYNYSGNYN